MLARRLVDSPSFAVRQNLIIRVSRAGGNGYHVIESVIDRVTYDEDADAAYFYLQYRRWFTRLRQDEQRTAETYSHSVNPTGQDRFDAQCGFPGVFIPTANAVKSVNNFLFFTYELIDE